MGLDMELTEEQREKLEYFVNNAPDFLMERMKEEFSNVGDEEKQEMLRQLDQMPIETIMQMVEQMQQIDPAMLEQMEQMQRIE